MLGNLNAFQRWLIHFLLSKAVEEDKIGNYMCRFWLWRKKDKNKIQYRLHNILRSDYGYDLHNHPSWYFTIILSGGYWETVVYKKAEDIPKGARLIDYMRRGGYKAQVWHGAGSILFRGKDHYHKLILDMSKPITWTFFIFGKVKDNDWGFKTNKGFSSHHKYLGEHNDR
jgi:hypothetical protein